MEKTSIEWTDSSWSPISGCRHGCKYCYARRIAERFHPQTVLNTCSVEDGVRILNDPVYGIFKSGKEQVSAYPYGFEPTYHRYRINDLDSKNFGKRIFVCSMSDMFGYWIPDWIIKEIFDECIKHPEHEYLFLTKNPGRYLDLAKQGDLPKLDNFWYGSTVTTQENVFFYASSYHTFLSIEPILEPFTGKNHSEEVARLVDWAILGAETGNRPGKVKPEREWVEDIVEAFKNAGKPIFMKDSMKGCWGEDIITQTPWD